MLRCKNLLYKALTLSSISRIITIVHGGVAQLGERLNGIQEVRGSIPLVSTISYIE